MNRTKAEQVFRSYTDHYDSSDVKIKLKIDHTFRVAEIADRIAAGLGADRDFAWLSGLLHDIGRFEQVKRYGTFYDAVSIDHAELSADILFKDGLFAEFEKALFFTKTSCGWHDSSNHTEYVHRCTGGKLLRQYHAPSEL